MQPEKNDNLLSGLAKKLVEAKLLTAADAMQAIEEAHKKKESFTHHLIDSKLVDSYQLAYTASKAFGDPLLDINAIDIEMLPKELVTEKLMQQHHAVPLYYRGNRLYVGISDPTNFEALDEFKFHTGIKTEAVIIEEKKLHEFIEKLANESDSTTFTDLEDADLDALDIASEEDNLPQDTNESDADDAPIVRFINKILLDAVNNGVSDLHFEPYETNYRIRVRQDGILHEVASPPINLGGRLAARLKVMSRLDISERRIPQDGRFKMKISKNRAIDFRLSTCPTLFGEKIVMRVLDPGSAKIGVDALGFEAFQKEKFMESIHKPQGLVLVTGPTGSGKTVTLYTGLNILNKDDVNISTVEDPVEINLFGINQVNVNNKAGLNFSTALRSFLRQDPDIIMVGEIRDLETAEIAVKASQTGHMVLSTLHTNSAPETLTRLVNMGIHAFNLATSVTLVIAQRLARRLCPHCKKSIDVPKNALVDLGFTEEDLSKEFELFEPVGCEQCHGGFKGRVGLYEVLPITESISRIIMEGGNAIDILDEMKRLGFPTLRRAGLNKVIEGLTTLEELGRVTKE